jgi:hypothetical protein
VWKVLGVAAFAGVAAGGVLIARDERRRESYTPDEVRERLQARLAEAQARASGGAQGDGDV